MKINKIYQSNSSICNFGNSNNTKKTKEIGPEAAKCNAWWRAEYRKAKEIQDAIENKTYKYEEKSIYNENGSLNLEYFHGNWNPYGEDGLI